jgi:hypothetical protein
MLIPPCSEICDVEREYSKRHFVGEHPTECWPVLGLSEEEAGRSIEDQKGAAVHHVEMFASLVAH